MRNKRNKIKFLRRDFKPSLIQPDDEHDGRHAGDVCFGEA